MLLVRAYKEEMGKLQHLHRPPSLWFNIVVRESFLESHLSHILTGAQESLVKIFAPVASRTTSIKL